MQCSAHYRSAAAMIRAWPMIGFPGRLSLFLFPHCHPAAEFRYADLTIRCKNKSQMIQVNLWVKVYTNGQRASAAWMMRGLRPG